MFTSYLQPKVLIEYNRRWNLLKKESFIEYITLIENDTDIDDWFTGIGDIKRSYESFIQGDLMRRLPKGLINTPDKILKEVIEESNIMINYEVQ